MCLQNVRNLGRSIHRERVLARIEARNDSAGLDRTARVPVHPKSLAKHAVSFSKCSFYVTALANYMQANIAVEIIMQFHGRWLHRSFRVGDDWQRFVIDFHQFCHVIRQYRSAAATTATGSFMKRTRSPARQGYNGFSIFWAGSYE